MVPRPKEVRTKYKPMFAVYAKANGEWVVQWKDGKYGELFESEREARKANRDIRHALRKWGVEDVGPIKIVKIDTPEKMFELYQKHQQHLGRLHKKRLVKGHA